MGLLSLAVALLIGAVEVKSLNTCSSVCACYTGMDGQGRMTYTAECSSRSLREVPKDIPERTTSIIMSHNDLSNQKKLNWSHWPNLTELVLDHTSLQNISINHLFGASRLRKLWLDYNVITRLPADAF